MDNPVDGGKHITSLVVHARPDSVDDVIRQIENLECVQIYTGDPPGKFIALMETDDESQILEGIDRIQDIRGVLSATMVYHHVDE